MQEKETNVGTVERVIRVLGGGLLAAVSLLLLIGGASWWGAALEIAGIALGLDFVYTGLTGYCPLYHKLGRSTNQHNVTGAI
jgi:hypothetical protein